MKFAAHVPASVHYGPNLRALATRLSIEQRLPWAQVVGLLNECSGTSFSERSLELTLQKAVQLSKPLRHSIAAELHQSDILHFDEGATPFAERTCYASWLLCKSSAQSGLRGYTSSCWACMKTLAEPLRQRLFSENTAACASKPMPKNPSPGSLLRSVGVVRRPKAATCCDVCSRTRSRYCALPWRKEFPSIKTKPREICVLSRSSRKSAEAGEVGKGLTTTRPCRAYFPPWASKARMCFATCASASRKLPPFPLPVSSPNLHRISWG